jgi:parallel beta-helix repeat protein
MAKTLQIVIILLFLTQAASAAVIDCNNCTDCNSKIQNASIGDVVRLTANITDHWGTCINFADKDGVTFDGMGHTIDGARDAGSYGIYLPAYSNNNRICNCTIIDFWGGIYLYTASYNVIENITSCHNRDTGITILYGAENTIRDCSLQENSYYDFYFRPYPVSDCNNTLINVTGSGGRTIGFYNQNTSLKDLEFAALYLCDADGSTLDNISIIGSSSHSNNGMRMYYTDNATLIDVESSDNFEGLSMDDSNDNTIIDGVFNNSWHYNVFISEGERNLLKNIAAGWSKQCGVYLYHAPHNVLTGVTATSNHIGLKLDTSGSTVINGSVITDSLIVGLSGGDADDNLVYNNYFDNIKNVDGSLGCTWNITPFPGTNIIGGPSIGGNYWGDYAGDDLDGDGFGEAFYDTGYGHDYCPLVELPVLCGDVDDNGHISANDVVEAYRRAVDPNYPVLSEWAADVDGNGHISANDVVEIYRAAVDPNHTLNCS